MKIEFEWYDGSTAVYSVSNSAEAWHLVDVVDPTGKEIRSAWRDDEPWFGFCTQANTV